MNKYSNTSQASTKQLTHRTHFFFKLSLLKQAMCAIAALLALNGCGQATQEAAPLNKQAEPAATASQPALAEPRDYETVAANQLGVNENGKGLALGQHVDTFTLLDIDQQPYAITQAWRNLPALIIFYRGGWCPYCNGQVRDLAINYPKLKAAGVQPVLISVDEVDHTARLGARYQIPFPVLSDPDLVAHRAFNVVLEIDEQTREKYREYGIDLGQWNQQGHNSIAVASIFLLDRKGHVLVSHAPADYRSRPSIEQLLQLINQHL